MNPNSKLQQRQSTPVPVRVAASLVYFELRSRVSATSDPEGFERALNDAAYALAQIADIYYENPLGHVLRIPEEDLRSGLFEQGAKVFKSANGTVYQNLSMRRIDLMYAMEVLRKAGQALSRMRFPKSPAEGEQSGANPAEDTKRGED
jgi:hypothetical protein